MPVSAARVWLNNGDCLGGADQVPNDCKDSDTRRADKLLLRRRQYQPPGAAANRAAKSIDARRDMQRNGDEPEGRMFKGKPRWSSLVAGGMAWPALVPHSWAPSVAIVRAGANPWPGLHLMRAPLSDGCRVRLLGSRRHDAGRLA